MLRIITAICLLIGISAGPVSAASLTKSDHQGYARSCASTSHDVIDEHQHYQDIWDKVPNDKIKTEYRYWNATIKSVGSNGANIEIVVRMTALIDNSDGGWSDVPNSKEFYYTHCIFKNMKKGDFSPPAFVILHSPISKDGDRYAFDFYPYKAPLSKREPAHWDYATSFESRISTEALEFKRRTDIPNWKYEE